MSAPYSRIAVAPDPASSGTSLTLLADDGPKFPAPPFIGIVWPVQTNPAPGISEELEVSAVVGDVVTFERGSAPIEIEAGMMFGVLTTVPAVKLGEAIRLEISYTTAEPPYTLRYTKPDGSVGTATGAAGVDDEGDTVYYVELAGDVPGRWTYRWEVSDVKAATADASFFVRFTGSQ